MSAELREDIANEALALGFSGFGVARPDSVPEIADRLESFVSEGRHGQMGWMAERMHWRGSPPTLWPEARSVIMLADAYNGPQDLWGDLDRKDRGVISAYAGGKDYHDIVKRRLKQLGRWLIAKAGGDIKVFVDTAPVMEKPLAAAAGLGWQGKHTNLVGRNLGNWFFLGAIFTTLDLPVDEKGQDTCGSCRACLDVCPTNAFPAPYQLDATKCISYLTIEHRGPIDPDLRGALGNRIYGCDDCLAVCPWNKFAKTAAHIGYSQRPASQSPALKDLARLDDAAFRAMFAGSPIKRIGRDRFVRNVTYAIGNSDDKSLLPVAQSLCADMDETVAEAAVWAVEKLSK